MNLKCVIPLLAVALESCVGFTLTSSENDLEGLSLAEGREEAVTTASKQKQLRMRQDFLGLESGLEPFANTYAADDSVPLTVSRVESLRRLVPYDFSMIPGCKPLDWPNLQTTSLFEFFGGSGEVPLSLYDFVAKQDIPCQPVCASTTLGTNEIELLGQMIGAQYRVQMKLDDLPVVIRERGRIISEGIPLGFEHPRALSPDVYDFYIYNHLRFRVVYHEDSVHQAIRITEFNVQPVSIQHDTQSWRTCRTSPQNSQLTYMPLEANGADPIRVGYTYEVKWVPSSRKWSNRWKIYTWNYVDGSFRWLSILNSTFLVFTLISFITRVGMKNLKKEMEMPDDMEDHKEEDINDGWKALRGDVFRPPRLASCLCVMVGNGMQLAAAFVSALVFANHNKSSQTILWAIVVYTLSTPIGSCVAANLSMLTSGKGWKWIAFLSAAGLPSVFMVGILALNGVRLQGGSGVQIVVLVRWFLQWLLLALLLAMGGAYWGLRKTKRLSMPTKTSETVRAIPKLANKSQLILWAITFLPFTVCFVELHYVQLITWRHQRVNSTTPMLVMVVLYGIACILVSIICTAGQLTMGNHRWWWSSFWSCGVTGVNVFVYGLRFWYRQLEFEDSQSAVIYIVCMALMSLCVGVLSGSVSFLASLWFVRLLYGGQIFKESSGLFRLVSAEQRVRRLQSTMTFRWQEATSTC